MKTSSFHPIFFAFTAVLLIGAFSNCRGQAPAPAEKKSYTRFEDVLKLVQPANRWTKNKTWSPVGKAGAQVDLQAAQGATFSCRIKVGVVSVSTTQPAKVGLESQQEPIVVSGRRIVGIALCGFLAGDAAALKIKVGDSIRVTGTISSTLLNENFVQVHLADCHLGDAQSTVAK